MLEICIHYSIKSQIKLDAFLKSNIIGFYFANTDYVIQALGQLSLSNNH